MKDVISPLLINGDYMHFPLLFHITSLCVVQEVQRPEESNRPLPAPDTSRPPSRTSRRSPGQLQL